MQQKLYRRGGSTFSIGNVGIPIPLGQTVGGTTTVNSGTCYRTPDRVLHEWQEELGLASSGPTSSGRTSIASRASSASSRQRPSSWAATAA